MHETRLICGREDFAFEGFLPDRKRQRCSLQMASNIKHDVMPPNGGFSEFRYTCLEVLCLRNIRIRVHLKVTSSGLTLGVNGTVCRCSSEVPPTFLSLEEGTTVSTQADHELQNEEDLGRPGAETCDVGTDDDIAQLWNGGVVEMLQMEWGDDIALDGGRDKLRRWQVGMTCQE